MKANDLIKKGKSIKEIYEMIESDNKMGNFKTCLPHQVFIPDGVKIQLIEDGFKIYNGKMFNDDCLIIEW